MYPYVYTMYFNHVNDDVSPCKKGTNNQHTKSLFPKIVDVFNKRRPLHPYRPRHSLVSNIHWLKEKLKSLVALSRHHDLHINLPQGTLAWCIAFPNYMVERFPLLMTYWTICVNQINSSMQQIVPSWHSV